jgi:methyltransferase (TIGR00027 family)
MESAAIHDVSDTAIWVAEYRAMETERADACFRDPLARRLVGDRGPRIVDELPRGRQNAWALVARTCSIDRMVRDAVERDVDLVLNLAAGLDTRPYRMNLPASLSWVEVDYPRLLDHKNGKLHGEKPSCSRESVGLDLAVRADRRALFARLGQAKKRALVLTEGLLPYLTATQVGDLADDLHEQPTFLWWVTDLIGPEALARVNRMWGRFLAKAPMHFAPREGSAFFADHGFCEVEYRSQLDEVLEIRRAPWFFRVVNPFLSAKGRETFRRMAGVTRLERVV